jgi:hypothetical protein
MAAPRATGQRAAADRSARPSRQPVEDEDDFADTDVANLLD